MLKNILGGIIMKNAFKKVLCLLTAVLMLILCACNNSAENNSSLKENEATLETILGADKINFDANYVQVNVYSDTYSFFTNRNKDFYKTLVSFLKNTKFPKEKTDLEKQDVDNFYITVDQGESSVCFSIYKNDVIVKHDVAEFTYYCEGIYKKFEKAFSSYLLESQKYCHVAPTKTLGLYEYVIYDKNGNTLKSDTSNKTPYLFYDNGIVHFWMQTGTGTLTRWATFYDVERGLISPEYYGQTDYFGDMVSATDHSQVVIYEMFTGMEICRFTEFEKPLSDAMENIRSAYFSKDGSKIIVEYLTADDEIATESFDINGNKSTKNPEIDAQFLSVLNSEAPFISEDGKSVLLKNYSYGTNGATEVYYAIPQEYAVVDLDGDSTNEVIADITQEQLYYIVFHKYNNNIYGFLIGRRSLQDLKKDGSFSSSGGAGLAVYSRMEFNKNTYKVIDTAYSDDYDSIYKIDGKEVTKEAIDKYKSEWDLKEDAHFTRFSK